MTAKPIRATFAGYRPVPSRSVGALTFEVPLEGLDAAVAALGGTPLPSRSAWVAIVRLGDDRPAAGAAHREDAGATPSLDPPAAEPKPPAHPLVKRAGMLATNPGFQRWSGCADAQSAAGFIRTRCQVASRRDLPFDHHAARLFEALEAEYLASQYSPHLTGRK